jgi:hypothetical protein
MVAFAEPAPGMVMSIVQGDSIEAHRGDAGRVKSTSSRHLCEHAWSWLMDGLFTGLFSHSVYPSLSYQDPRYYYQGSACIKSRVLHAASFAVITRNDRGQNVPNYSYLAGAMNAGHLTPHYPRADGGAHLVFTNTAIYLVSFC